MRYVLEGSVQRSGNHIRVNAQLIDPETNAQLWAERFDRDIGDLFAMQNEITSRIAVALNFALVGAEAARPNANPDALDYFFRGRAVLSKSNTPDSFAEAIGLFERALAVDPQSVRFQSFLALALTGRVLDGMSSTETADNDPGSERPLSQNAQSGAIASAQARTRSPIPAKGQGRPHDHPPMIPR